MFKVIAMMKRRPELTHEQFRDYMERHHAPFALRELAKALPIGLRHYLRNYFTPMPDGLGLIMPLNNEYDVITEFWFNDKDTYEKFAAWHARDVAAIVRADEARFIGGGSMAYIEQTEDMPSLIAAEISLPTDREQ